MYQERVQENKRGARRSSSMQIRPEYRIALVKKNLGLNIKGEPLNLEYILYIHSRYRRVSLTTFFISLSKYPQSTVFVASDSRQILLSFFCHSLNSQLHCNLVACRSWLEWKAAPVSIQPLYYQLLLIDIAHYLMVKKVYN